jgi:hypothetical protein
MTSRTFILKKANASTKLAYFSKAPSWEDLTSKITHLFNIPSDRVDVAFVEKDEQPITLTNEGELQDLYKWLPSELIKLVVQDTSSPDSECTFQCHIISCSRNYHISIMYTFSLHSSTHSTGFRLR